MNAMNPMDGTGEQPVVPPRRLWWLGAAFVSWCSALVVLYGVHAIGCAFGWSAFVLRASLVAMFAVHLVAIGWMWMKFARARPSGPPDGTAAFVHDAIVWSTMAAFASMLLALAPSLLLKACI
jgi:hypothetical protein